MCLPSGSIYLYSKDGTGGNICMIDLSSKDEFIEELKYLFTKCGYEIDKYDYACYVDEDNFTIYKVNVSRETLGL